MWNVQLFKLNYDEKESEAVNEVLKSGWITMGEKTKLFEDEFSHYLGENTKASVVTNGTAALHLALLACDVVEGDEVILPALTFVADLNVVKIQGAIPILADSTSLSDWNVSPSDIESKITSRTKAIIIVHFAGYPCDMDAILDICTRHNIALIEDVAHAPGAEYRGRKCGTFGKANCFSFFTNKNLSVGEGGMVTSTAPDLIAKVSKLRSHGMSALTLDRYKGRSVSYDVEFPGLNYRIDEIRSALGLVQLAKLDAANQRRRMLVGRYNEAFISCKNISLPFTNLLNCKPAYHIYPILLADGIDRKGVAESLKQKGIQCSIHYPSFLNFTGYSDLCSPESIPLASQISARELTLPLYPTMTDEELQAVVEAVRAAVE